MSPKERRHSLAILFDVYWFIRKRKRRFFWATTILLTVGMGGFIYLETSTLEHVWIALFVGPGIMLFLYLAHKFSRYEAKHGLTHHKSYNGSYIHTTFPMKKDPKNK
jgi:hypothetical protein